MKYAEFAGAWCIIEDYKVKILQLFYVILVNSD